MNVDEEDSSMNGSSDSLKYENKDLKTKWKITIFYFVIFISSVFCWSNSDLDIGGNLVKEVDIVDTTGLRQYDALKSFKYFIGHVALE